jgi:hypothetical protein
MIKRGDFIRCNHVGKYRITNEHTICLALSDAEICTGSNYRPAWEITVILVEDNRPGNPERAVGRMYHVDARYFDVVDYVDEGKYRKRRLPKLASKLSERRKYLSTSIVNQHLNQHQITYNLDFENDSKLMTWCYIEDNGLKIIEFTLNPNDTVRKLKLYEVSREDLMNESALRFDGELRRIRKLLTRYKKYIKTTTLYEEPKKGRVVYD